MFDVDGDGLISYSEYLLLITFLSIPVEVRAPEVTNLTKRAFADAFGSFTAAWSSLFVVLHLDVTSHTYSTCTHVAGSIVCSLLQHCSQPCLCNLAEG